MSNNSNERSSVFMSSESEINSQPDQHNEPTFQFSARNYFLTYSDLPDGVAKEDLLYFFKEHESL